MLVMSLYRSQEELEALVNDYRRDLERRESLRRNRLKGRPSPIQRVRTTRDPPRGILNPPQQQSKKHAWSFRRMCATQSSTLWTCISLGDFDEAVFDHRRACIQRAGLCPLLLVINPNNKRMNPDALLEAVPKAAGKCEWKSIQPWTSQEFVSYLLCLRPFTHLRSLILDFWEKIDTTRVLVPWGQLTNLKLTSGVAPRLYLSILRHCVNLESCTLQPHTASDYEILWNNSYKRQPLLLPKVKQLHLSTFEVPSLLPDNLQCPALEDATFFHEHEKDEGNCSFLFSSLESCGKTLLKLGLPGVAIDSDHDFQQMLPHLKVLEELTITGPLGWPDKLECYEDTNLQVYDAGIYAFFSALKNQPRSLPNLKILRMLEQRTEEKIYVERELAPFLESRL
ncbi:hypothetical protein NLJ89_g1605 [Agrocybe chaxingu]|uniref:Uncharacterized protein n=1 Tax=Agrocybe chaxingu TaxID=84603 RepID=A0A9W8MZP4_9AGAR|nr:hypothetical protein NLJ89_g1605 [Agrocybe chaxingu]